MPNSVTTPLQGGSTHHDSQVLGQLTPAQLTAKYPGLTLKTATKSFAFPFKGHTVHFSKGIPVMCAPDLLAALISASAAVI
jgi:hypothetical protein